MSGVLQVIVWVSIPEHSCPREAKVVRSPLTPLNRKQDFLSCLSTDLYRHCTPHPKARWPLGGYYPIKKSRISKMLQSSFSLCSLCCSLSHFFTHSTKSSGTWKVFSQCSSMAFTHRVYYPGTDLAQIEGLFTVHETYLIKAVTL